MESLFFLVIVTNPDIGKIPQKKNKRLLNQKIMDKKIKFLDLQGRQYY